MVNMLMYAIVLTMTGKAKTELAQLQADYSTYMNYSIEPHVTLKQPFTLKTNIDVLCNKLTEIAEQTEPFTLILEGIRYWEGKNNVAYMAVQNRQPVADLHLTLIHAIQELITGDTTYDLGHFTPHLTISENIHGEVLPSIKKELSEYDLKYNVKMTSFSLFQAEPNEKYDIWEYTRIFRFTRKRDYQSLSISP